MELSKQTIRILKRNDVTNKIVKKYNKILKLNQDPLKNIFQLENDIKEIKSIIKEIKTSKIDSDKEIRIKDEKIEELHPDYNLNNIINNLNYQNNDLEKSVLQENFKILLALKLKEYEFLEVMRSIHNKTHVEKNHYKTTDSDVFKIWVLKFPRRIKLNVDLNKYYPNLIHFDDLDEFSFWPVDKLLYFCNNIHHLEVNSKETKQNLVKIVKEKILDKIELKTIKDEKIIHKASQNKTGTENSGEMGTTLSKDIIEEIETFLDDLSKQIDKGRDQFKRKFAPELDYLLKKIGLSLSGHYPLLKTAYYTIEVHFDRPSVIIWYGPRKEKIDNCKIEPMSVVNCIKQNHENLTERLFNSEEFISILFEAYKISLFRESKSIGDLANLSKVLLDYIFLIQNQKFKQNPQKGYFSEYSRTMFSYDLHRLKNKKIKNLELKLITATRADTAEQSDFFWIPTNEKGDGGYYANIKFKEFKKDE